MSTILRQKAAEEYGIIHNIGKRITPFSSDHYRYGDIAEIIGWSLTPSPSYHIRYDNGECDVISADALIEHRYVFVFID